MLFANDMHNIMIILDHNIYMDPLIRLITILFQQIVRVVQVGISPSYRQEFQLNISIDCQLVPPEPPPTPLLTSLAWVSHCSPVPRHILTQLFSVYL